MEKPTFLIAGKHAVTEALRNPHRKVLKIYLTEESKKNLNRNNIDLNLFKNIILFFSQHQSVYTQLLVK